MAEPLKHQRNNFQELMWQLTMSNEMMTRSAIAVNSISAHALRGVHEILNRLEDPKDWLEVQQLGLRRYGPGVEPIADEETRSELLASVMKGRLTGDGLTRIQALQDIAEDKEPLQAWREGLPIRTGFDVDWEAAFDDPAGLLQDAGALTAGLMTDPASVVTGREGTKSFFKKYFHLDSKNFFVRRILGIGSDSPYNERALSQSVMRTGKINASLYWDVGEWTWGRAMLGDEIWTKLNQLNLATIADTRNLTDREPTEAKWYDISAANLLAATTLVFNDPIVLADIAFDEVPRMIIQRLGGKFRTTIKGLDQIIEPEYYDEYLTYRAQYPKWNKQTKKPDLHPPLSFEDWFFRKRMSELEGPSEAKVLDHPEIQSIDAEFQKALENNSSTEVLQDIIGRRRDKMSEIRNALIPEFAPYNKLFDQLEQVTQLNDMEIHFIRSLEKEERDLPAVIHDFLRGTDMRGQPVHKRYRDAENLRRSGNPDLVKQGEDIQAAVYQEYQGLFERAWDETKGLSTSQRMMRMDELIRQNNVLRKGIAKYRILRDHAIAGTDNADQAANLINAVMAGMAAGLDNNAARAANRMPYEGLLDDISDLSQLNESELIGLKSRDILRDPQARGYFRDEHGGQLTADSAGEELAYWTSKTQDPYFSTRAAREVGLDWETAQRSMVDYAKEIDENPAWNTLTRLSRRNTIANPGVRKQRERLGHILTLGTTRDAELILPAIKPIDMSPEDLATHVRTRRQAYVDKVSGIQTEFQKLTQEFKRKTERLFDKLGEPGPSMKSMLEAYDDDITTLEHQVSQLPPNSSEAADLYRTLQERRAAREDILIDWARSQEGWHSTDAKGIRGSLLELRNKRDQLHKDFRNALEEEPTVSQIVNELTDGNYTIDYEKLAQVTGKELSSDDLELLGQLQDLTDHLWDSLIRSDPDIVDQLPTHRNFISLMDYLQSVDPDPLSTNLTQHSIFRRGRQGEDVSYDIGEAINYAIQNVNRRVHNRPILKKLERMAERASNMGDTNAAAMYRSIANRLSGTPQKADTAIDRSWYRAVKHMPLPIRLKEKLMRHQIGRPSKVAMSFVRGMYIGHLFLNPSYMIKNLMGMGNTATIFGRMPTLKGFFRALADPHDVYKKAGLTMDLEQFYGGSDTLDKLTRKAMSANAFTENILRATAWYARYDEVLDEWYEQGLIKARNMDAVREAGLEEQMMREGLNAAFETQHIYGGFGRPVYLGDSDILHSQILRPAQQFVNFTLKQTAFGLRRGFYDQGFTNAIRFLAITGEQIRIAESLGIDASTFSIAAYGQQEFVTPEGPNPTALASPGTQFLWDVTYGIMHPTSPEAKRAAETVGIWALGSRGVPAGRLLRWARQSASPDPQQVYGRDGRLRAVLAEEEVPIKQVLGLPTVQDRKRNELWFWRKNQQLNNVLARQRLTHQIESLMQNMPENGKINSEQHEELATEIRKLYDDHNYIATNEAINSIINKRILPDELRHTSDLGLMDQASRAKWAELAAPYVERQQGAAAAQQMLSQVLSADAADVLAKLNINTVGDLHQYVVPDADRREMIRYLAEWYHTDEDNVVFHGGKPYVWDIYSSGGQWVPVSEESLGTVLGIIKKEETDE